MEDFNELLKGDKQLQYSKSSIRYFKATPTPPFLTTDVHAKNKFNLIPIPQPTTDTTNSSGFVSVPVTSFLPASHNSPMGTYFKRHILAVDDLTKINYEVIKNTPGSFQSIESPESDPILESEINLTKSKLFKNNLYSQNDAVLQSIANKLQLGDIVNNEEANEYHQIEKKIPIEKQISWLKQINQNLIKQYNSLLKEEKKWFILKELLLDANTEWDLYKSIDTAPNSKIRNDNMDNQKYTSISNTDNTATDKTSQSIPTKKDSKRLYYKLGLPELTSQQNTLVFNREQNIFFKKQKISEHGLKSIVSTSTPSSDSSPFVTASPLDSRTSDSQISDNKSED